MTARHLFPVGSSGSVESQSRGKPAARFPGAIATDSDLAIAVDRQQSALASSLDSVSTSMTVTNAAVITAYNLLSIDSEIVKVTAAPTGNVVPIQRGFDGTVPTLHSAGALVYGYIDAWHHNALVAEVEALEQTLGANLANLPAASPPVPNTAYDFAAQTPGGALGVGTNSITLSPVPAGVNGSDQNHGLYISGGTGAPEVVPITGGSAVAGAASGSIFVTCANAHSGAWTIKSGSAGIIEAMQSLAPKAPWVKVPPGSYNIYCEIFPPTGATLEGSGALYDSNPPPVILNWIPLSGSMIVISADHVTIRGLTLYGGTSGTPTTSIGIDVSGFAPRAAITVGLFDLYVQRFNIGILAQDLSNPRAQGLAAFNNVSHGFVFASVQGPWWDLFSQANGGDGFHLTTGGSGNTASPFLNGLQTHDNAGWGINTVLQINLRNFYLNFDKAGEMLINTGVGVSPGTIIDGHIEEGGHSISYGIQNNSPGIRVAATSTSGVVVNHVQINTNQGNGLEFLGPGSNLLIASDVTGNGIGGQAGSIYAIYATSAGNQIANNNISSPSYFSGGNQQIMANLFGDNSSNPCLNIAGGGNHTIEGNFINQAGAGTALTLAAPATVYGPFTNNVFGGGSSILGAVFPTRQYIAANYIQSETGANNAIVGSLPAVPFAIGLRVSQKLSHSLQAGANTYNYNGTGAKSIVSHCTGANLTVGYTANLIIDLMVDPSGSFWMDMSQ